MTMVEMLKGEQIPRSFFSFPPQHTVILRRRRAEPSEEEPVSSRAVSVNGGNTASDFYDYPVPESGQIEYEAVQFFKQLACRS
jgi:hypothetical protein